MTRPRVAIAHDFLNVKGGGERVALALARAFPGATIHTSLHRPESTFPEFDELDVRTSWRDGIDRFRADHRLALPLLPAAFRSMLIAAAVVIASSAGFAHHVRTTGTKVVYCHTPARWLHDTDRYLAGFGPVARSAAKGLRLALIGRDRAAMGEADIVLANSPTTADEVREVYGIEATVVPPCSSLDLAGPVRPIDGVAPGFVLCPSRILGYKRLDVLVEAARLAPGIQFLHVGDGPHRAVVEDGPPNLVTAGAVDDAALRWAYRNARAVAITCAEDFGRVPLEAHAHDLRSVIPFARGLIENAGAQRCGRYYQLGSARSLLDALEAIPVPTHRALHPDRLGADSFGAAVAAQLRVVAA